MSELEPTRELPDDKPIREVQFPTRVKDALFAAGLKRQVRETSDKALLALPDYGRASVAQLHDTLGLPRSCASFLSSCLDPSLTDCLLPD